MSATTPVFCFWRKEFYLVSLLKPVTQEAGITIWLARSIGAQCWGAVYDERVTQGQVNERDEYHRLAREHLARQPSIQDDLLEALRANVCTSYRNLSRYINGWCTAGTIEHWFKLHEDYHLYSKNIKPGLTPDNKIKQVLFSQHVHNLWGLPRNSGRPILWTSVLVTLNKSHVQVLLKIISYF